MLFFKKKEPPRAAKRPPDPPPPTWARDPQGLLKSARGRVRAALTGGVASGKSTAAALFEAFGARIIDFDLLAREALAPQTPTFEAALALFGPKALLPDGSLDRPLLAKKIFRDRELRLRLEAIVHPFTWGRMLEELAKGPPAALTVIDIPLLYEASLHTLFSPVMVCFASPGLQIRRLLFRSPSLSKRMAKKILLNQLPTSEKLRHADIVLNNEGGMRELIRQTKAVCQSLTGPDWPPKGCRPPGGPPSGPRECPAAPEGADGQGAAPATDGGEGPESRGGG
jgi:dephospho-CoA kinase